MKYKFGVAMLSAALLAFAGMWLMDGVARANTPQEKEVETGAYLGVYLGNITDSTAKRLDLEQKEGALISRVIPGSPAHDAGLRRDDLVISVNGERISSSNDLIDAVKAYKPGDSIEITFIRNNVQQTLTVVLEKKKTINIKAPYIALRKTPGNVIVGRPFKGNYFSILTGRAQLGIEYRELNPELGEYFGLPDGKGILVTQVKEESAAGKAGMKAGDVILSVDGKEITNSEDLRKALWRRNDDDKESLEVVVMRHNQRVTLNVEVENSRFQNMWIAPRDFEGHLDLLDENLEDLEFDMDFDIDIPEINIDPSVDIDIDSIISGFKDGFGHIGIMLPDGLNFRLEVRDDGTVTFNDKDFESVKEFKEYLKSKEFKDLAKEIREKQKKIIKEKLDNVRVKIRERKVI